MIDPRCSHRGKNLLLPSEPVCRWVGRAQSIRFYKGSEFIFGDLTRGPTKMVSCSTLAGLKSRLVMPSPRPIDGKFLVDGLNAQALISLDETKAKLEQWGPELGSPQDRNREQAPISIMNAPGLDAQT